MKINLNILNSAQKHYEEHGYKNTDVPWIVSQVPYEVTKPPGAKDFATLGGNLVASGEQSFIEMMLNGIKIDRAQCFTPCFRDEVVDELHYTYFAKIELIDCNATEENLAYMIKAAAFFFNLYTDVEVVELGSNLFDIIDKHNKIEVGSYGIREYQNLKWIYGTGLAQPRFDQVISMPPF